jgi:hypothetical protein
MGVTDAALNDLGYDLDDGAALNALGDGTAVT